MHETTNAEWAEIKLLVESQGRAIDEIRQSQIRVANALLGSLDNNSVGLIEAARILRKEVDINNAAILRHHEQIDGLVMFRSDIKKIVAGIALLVPIGFEVVKGLGAMLWEYVRSK